MTSQEIRTYADRQVTLPFKVPNLFVGLAEGEGLAKVSFSELALEFVVKDNVLKVFKTGLKEIRIPRSELDVIRLKQGWFKDKICIRVKSMRWVADLPGCDSGELTLHVARRNRVQAKDFV